MPNLGPRPFVLASTVHGPMIVSHLDRHTINDQTFGVGHQLLTTGIYDQDELSVTLGILDLLRHYRAPNGERTIRVIDGGANIGAFTVPWAQHMTGWGYVTAIEAQPMVFYALCGSVALNNLFNVRCVHALISDHNSLATHLPEVDYTAEGSLGSVPLDTAVNDSGLELRYHDFTGWVPMTHLGQWDPTPDFVKLDIEGMEAQALTSVTTLMLLIKPIFCIEHLKSDKDALVKLLTSWGYTTFMDSKNIWGMHKDDPIIKHINIKEG